MLLQYLLFTFNLILITVAVQFVHGEEGKVKIQLYYESLCPDCREFDTNSFIPTIKKLGEARLDVHVYPFGNAIMTTNPDGTVKIDCQHGPEECYGNMLHACAIKHLNNFTEAIIYNGCMMDLDQWPNGGSDDVAADKCAKDKGIDSEPIKMCAKGTEGFNLLKYYGEESKKVVYDGVPYIIVNGEAYSGDNFLEYICSLFKQRPKQCDGHLNDL